MLQDAEWGRCIDRLYDAVGRESELSQSLGEFRAFFDARGVTFLTVADMRNPSTSHIGSIGVPEASLVDYHSHFAAHDEWVLAAYQRPGLGVGTIHRGSELVSRTALRRSYFWKEFLSRPNNYTCGGNLEANTTALCSMVKTQYKGEKGPITNNLELGIDPRSCQRRAPR